MTSEPIHFNRTSIELDTTIDPSTVPSLPASSHAPSSLPSSLPSSSIPSSQQKPYLHLLAGLYHEAKSMFSVTNAKQTILPHITNIKNFFTDFSLADRLTQRQRVYLMLFGGFLSALILLYKLTRPPPKRITFASLRPSQHPVVYDVIVVGAGPSGTSCAFHLAKKGKKVLLLEKKAFPRDKYCGEAVTHYAQEQLEEMGVLQGILDDNLAYSVDVGGFVSPCGNSFVGSSRSVMDHLTPSQSSTPPPSPTSRSSSPRPASPAPAPSDTSPPSRPPSPRPHSPSPASPPATNRILGLRGVLTIKRVELDFRLAKAAQQAGAVLVENMNVQSADFDDTTGVWTVECKEEQHPIGLTHHRGSVITLGSGSAGMTGSFESTSIPVVPPSNEASQEHTKVTFHGRALVCADGASSRLARSLGVVHSEPTAVCSRSYVQPPHAFKWDGLLFYPSAILPGCCAIVRQVGGELSYLTFVNPAIGGLAKEEDLSRLHHEFIKTDPYISQALGPFIYLERMKAASLRIGGVGTGISLSNFRTVSTSRAPTSKDRSYGDHLLVVGDAAGFVDPFTGLGIQYALEGGKIAAGVLLEGFYQRDLSMQFLTAYEKRWEAAFGNQFYWSLKMGQLLCRFPILLDAMAKLIQRRGDQFLAEWMQAMTGTRSKTWFLSVAVWPFLFVEIILELVRRQFKNR